MHPHHFGRDKLAEFQKDMDESMAMKLKFIGNGESMIKQKIPLKKGFGKRDVDRHIVPQKHV